MRKFPNKTRLPALIGVKASDGPLDSCLINSVLISAGGELRRAVIYVLAKPRMASLRCGGMRWNVNALGACDRSSCVSWEKERAGHRSLGGGLEDEPSQLLRKNPQKPTRPWDELKEVWLRATEEQWKWPEESIRLPTHRLNNLQLLRNKFLFYYI